MTPTPRNAPKNEKPAASIQIALPSIVLPMLCLLAGAGIGVFACGDPLELSRARLEAKAAQEKLANAEKDAEHYQSLWWQSEKALGDKKAIAIRSNMTVFPVEDQSHVIAHQDRRIKQLESDVAYEKEMRRLALKEAAWIEKNGGEIVAVKVEENE